MYTMLLALWCANVYALGEMPSLWSNLRVALIWALSWWLWRWNLRFRVTLACCQRAMLRMYFDAPSAASVMTGKIAHVCWIHCVQRAASLCVICVSTFSNSHSDIAVIMERSRMSGASANFATARTAMPCATARRSRLLLCSSLMLGIVASQSFYR